MQLNQKTMAALDRLAEVYETFEDTWAFVEKEAAEDDLLLAEEDEAIDLFEAARLHQARILDELESCRESLDSAFREFNKCRPLHRAACADLKDASLRTTELNRKADEAHERSQSHKECCRRATKDHMMAERGTLQQPGLPGRSLVEDTAGATHALTWGVPDRESNETKYLKEALEMINDWQSRYSRRSSESHEGPDTTEEVLHERPQWFSADVCRTLNRNL